MKSLLSFMLSGLFALLIVTSARAEERVVAKVGDTTISETELHSALDSYKPPGAYHDVSGQKTAKFRQDALNDLIEIQLLYMEAKKRGIKAPEEVVDKVVEDNIKRFGSKNKLDEALRSQGMSQDKFRDTIRKYQAVMALLNSIRKESDYGTAELRRYYDKNRSKFRRPESIHLYHILIKVEPSATEDEWKKRRLYAEEVLKKIKSGQDFGQVAYKYSEDPYRFKSGDLGFIHKGQLNPKELEEAAFSLKKGEVSPLIRTIYGFHILKAGEKKPEEVLGFDEVKEKVRKELADKRFEEKKKDLLERLRKDYPVKIYIKFEDKGDKG